LAPIGFEVSDPMWSSLTSSASGAVAATVIIPSPPASDTAAHSSSEQTGPIPASWMGAVHPTRSVNLVLISPNPGER
jgi:hypothetical protein